MVSARVKWFIPRSCLLLGLLSPGDATAQKKSQLGFWDYVEVGGSVATTEGGSSVSATGAYRLFNQYPLVTLHGGAMWFTQQFHPFVAVNVTPRVNFSLGKHKFSFRPYANLAFTDVNSWFYTNIALGLSWRYGWRKSFLGQRPLILKAHYIMAGGLSYPKLDSTYSSMHMGVSVTWDDQFQIYTIPRLALAAPTAMETNYFGNYAFHFQGIESGLFWRPQMNRTWMLGAFADYDKILSKYGLRVLKYTSLRHGRERIDLRLWGGVGISKWTNTLAGSSDFIAFAGITVRLGGTPKSEFRGSYQHFRLGYVPRVSERDATTISGGTRSLAKKNLTAATDFAGFVKLYKGASAGHLVETARWLGMTIGNVGYATDASAALKSVDLFNPALKRIANATHGDIYAHLRRCTLDKKCDTKMTVCAGIHSLIADFLTQNGIDAVAVSVNSERTMHVVTVAMTADKTVLINYGQVFEAPAGHMDEVLRYYAIYAGKPLFWSPMFNKDGYVGTYQTPEAVLFQRTMGLYAPDLIRKDFWGGPM